MPLLFSIVLVPVGAFYALYGVDACITEVRKDGISRSHMRFQITETDCSTLGADASASVFGLDETGAGRTLLFKYGPASYDLPLPEIAVPDNDTILISVPVVSSVFLRDPQWNHRAINYNIGHIDYPDPGDALAR
jgi:hypothetical protein